MDDGGTEGVEGAEHAGSRAVGEDARKDVGGPGHGLRGDDGRGARPPHHRQSGLGQKAHIEHLLSFLDSR